MAGRTLHIKRRSRGAASCIESLEPRHLLSGTGLIGAYYNTTGFTGHSKWRLDPYVYFNFAKNPLPETIKSTTCSVRWTGSVRAAYTETYTFYTTSDEGIRLWVDHKLLVDNWMRHTSTEDSGSIALVAGQKYDLQLEYFNVSGPAAIQLWWSSPTVGKSVVPTRRLYPSAPNLKDQIDHAFSFAEAQYSKAITQLASPAVDAYDNAATASAWSSTTPDAWTAGFFPGALWQLYAHNTTKSWRLNATAWSRPIGPYATTPDDIGFRIWTSYFPMACSTKLASDKQVLVAAANAKMTSWNSAVGMFETSGGGTLTGNPAGDFPVIIDQSMDMSLLFWASKETGKTIYADRATAHLLKLAENFIRPDGSTIQLGYFNSLTGAFVGADVKQGYSATSTWSRGQAWAMSAFTDAWQQTGNTQFLQIATKLANYWLANVPSDGVPYWDFAAAGIPNTYRDSSAAAVAADVLLQLSQTEPDLTDAARYGHAAQTTLTSLLSPSYFAEGAASPGLLLHGAAWVSKGHTDNALIYGDYYLLQAMNHYLTA